MRLAKRILWAVFFFLPLLFLNTGNAFGVTYEEQPEVTARVARISFIRGEVQVRRGGDANQDWERAVLNLPLVEGDEISTDKNSLVEIQFDSTSHLRLAENSYLKFTTLRDEGAAVSLPQGTMNLRLLEFDKSRSYFEIDAPGSTISIEKSGMYRVDAGDTRNAEIFVTTTEGGEARIYSQSSGFTLRNGRTARIFIEGSYAGDYETRDVSPNGDEFDKWVLERDAVIAKRLKDSYYDKYYDRDIYGAEDLSDYGEWVYTRSYGYVWKPYGSSINSYANWSPYRYGHWRWVPVFGWTWVNDEPWGWATYHYGRWVYNNGYWCWSPYPQTRWKRSWWSPALVVVTWNGSLICWYPLPYDYGYYDYNRNWRYNRRRNNTTIININNNTTVVVVNPTPTPSTIPNPSPTQNPQPSQANIERGVRLRTPTFQRVPLNGVVAVDAKEFGRETKGFRTPPLETAKRVLSKTPDENQTPPILPDYKDLDGKVSREILIENPRQPKFENQVKTGAAERKINAPLDDELRKQRIFGNRTPIQPTIPQDTKGGVTVKPDPTEPRKTGVVTRPPVFKPDNNSDNETKQPRTPTNNPRTTNDDEQKNEQRPVYRPKQREENQTPPVYVPPPPEQKEERRQPTFPQQQEQPKQREEPRQQPQPQPQPKNEPKSEPKQEPQPERKPSPSVTNRKTEKDGRK